MPTPVYNKYRAAIDALHRGRDLMVEELADDILDRWSDNMMDGGYSFNEFLETHGTKLHFLGLVVSQLEQSAEALEESLAADPPPPPPKKRKPRAKKLPRQTSSEKKPDES